MTKVDPGICLQSDEDFTLLHPAIIIIIGDLPFLHPAIIIVFFSTLPKTTHTYRIASLPLLLGCEVNSLAYILYLSSAR